MPARDLWRCIFAQMFPGLHRRGGRSSGGRVSRPLCRPRLEQLEDRLAPAVFHAAPGDDIGAMILQAQQSHDKNNTLMVAPGTYTVIDRPVGVAPGKSISIVGNGAGVVFTANQNGRVFTIGGGSVRVENLTITGGLLQPGAIGPGGGGLWILAGNVVMVDVVVQGNTVLAAAGNAGADGFGGDPGREALGGGIYLDAGATLSMVDSTISGNRLVGGNGGTGGNGDDGPGLPGGAGGAARGGGIYVNNGTVFGDHLIIKDNVLVGGDGGDGGVGDSASFLFGGGYRGGSGGIGGEASGGGIFVDSGTVTLFGATLDNNKAAGGKGGAEGLNHSRTEDFDVFFPAAQSGGQGGMAAGGGCYVLSGTLKFVSPTLTGNVVAGGNGGSAAIGQGAWFIPGAGGSGGNALGGGIYAAAGDLALYGGVISTCRAVGGDGVAGADGATGTTQNEYAGIRAGASGGAGGIGGGGGIYVAGGAFSIYDTSLFDDSAAGGKGGNGGNGSDGHDGESIGDYGARNGGNGGNGGLGGAGGNALGGAGYLAAGTLALAGVNVIGAAARGGPGGNAGTAGNSGNGLVGLSGPPDGGEGGPGGDGGSGGNGGTGGHGGNALGGAVYAGSPSAAGGLFVHGGSLVGTVTGGPAGASTNGTDGGDGAAGGPGVGEYLDWDLEFHPFQDGPAGIGGDGGSSQGGDGGDAQGGGLYLASEVLQATISSTVNIGGGAAAGDKTDPGTVGAGGLPGAIPYAPGDQGISTPGKPGTVAGADMKNASSITPQTTGPAATQLVISPISYATAGDPLRYPVYVVAQDVNGSVAGDYAGDVSVVSIGPSNLIPGGTLLRHASNGVAAFGDLSITSGGGWKLGAFDGTIGALPSNEFWVTGYTPNQVRKAYGIDQIPTVTDVATGKQVTLDGSGQTIAIVIANHDPNIFLDLDRFNRQFGLTTPSDTPGKPGFLTVVGQTGLPTVLPSTSADATEHALDVLWVHAIAPGARILVVEANSSALSDQLAAVDTAVAMGASVVSMSWAINEIGNFQGPGYGYVNPAAELAADAHFIHGGVTFVASSADHGFADPGYPAFSPYVLAIGGTKLLLNSDSSYQSETGWGEGLRSSVLGGSAGGVSTVEPRPAYQKAVQSTGFRSIPDVSLLADLSTGAAIVDSHTYSPLQGIWRMVGGTSLAAPAWAGLIALINQGRLAAGHKVLNADSPNEVHSALYSIDKSNFHTNLGGDNGTSKVGLLNNPDHPYDYVTGLGSPKANLLVPALINHAPFSLTPGSVPIARVGVPYDQSITFVGGTAPQTINFQVASGTLHGLRITSNGTQVRIFGTPTDIGSFKVSVWAKDAMGEIAQAFYNVDIANAPPTLSNLSRSAWTQNYPGYTGVIQVNNGTGPFQLQLSGLPDQLQYSLGSTVGTLLIKGKPTVAGTFDVAVQVTDKYGAVASRNYQLTINPPVSLSLSRPAWTQNRPYTGTIQVSGGTRPYVGSSLIVTGLPKGLAVASFNTTTGLISFKGTPTIVGVYAVKATVKDKVGAGGSATYALRINAPIKLGKLSRTAWTQNQSGYVGVIRITGGTGPYTVQATGVPAGLATTIDPATGVVSITGTPTQVVHATVGITVKDASGAVASGKYALTINPPIALGTLSATAWTEGRAYKGIIQVKGGTGPYVGGSLAVSGLPAGLGVASFDTAKGVITISGIPSTPVATPNNVIVSVQDQTGALGSAIYTLVINPPVSLGPTSLPQGLANTPYSETITASGGTGVPGISFVVVGTVPTGLAIGLSDASILSITGTPTASGTVVVQVSATDAVGAAARQNYIVTIAPQGGLVDAPKITAISPPAGLTSGGTSVTITGTNLLGAIGVLFGDTLVTKFASATNTTWVVTSPPGAAGTVEVRVITGIGTSDPVSFQFVAPPVFSPGSLPAGRVGVAYNKTISVTGSETWLLSYQVIGPVPRGVKVTQSTPGGSIVISGKPAAAGSFKIKVTAKDALGVSVFRTYTVAIR